MIVTTCIYGFRKVLGFLVAKVQFLCYPTSEKKE